MPIVSSSAQHDLADINGSGNLEDYAIDHAYITALAGSGVFGGITDADVLAVISDTIDGVLSASYSALFYHRIWLIPKRLALGSITANQVRTIELWNAHLEAKTLDSVTVDGDVEVTGLESATLEALASTLYEVSITLFGAPTLAATITYAFSDAEVNEVVGSVSGRRVIPFALRHNWVDPVIEQISFKTDVLPASSGKEQRIGLREIPRRRVEMTYLTLTPQERAYVENVLYGWQNRAYAVPLWADKAPLRTATAIGATTFDVDTVARDFEVGSLVFITDGTNHDTLEIESLTDDEITTVTGSLSAYSVGSRVVPAKIAMLDAQFSLARITNHHESARLAWQLQTDQDSTTRRAAYTPETYRGIEVYNRGNDYSAVIGIEQTLREELLDNEIGVLTKFTDEPFPRRSYPFSTLLTRDELPAFIEWIYNRKGQLKPFWFVERVPAFFLQADASADDETLVVKGYEFHNLTWGADARKDIAILTSDGWKYRRITGSSVDTETGVETIGIDSALGVALLTESNPLISYLKFVRQSTDTVELSYLSTHAIRTATSFTDLLTNN